MDKQTNRHTDKQLQAKHYAPPERRVLKMKIYKVAILGLDPGTFGSEGKHYTTELTGQLVKGDHYTPAEFVQKWVYLSMLCF